MVKRNAFVLTTDAGSERALFSKTLLERIGFDVFLVNAIHHSDKVLSNKISMQHIYGLVVDGENEFSYVFEDDVNVLEDITLDEIVQYEKISVMFFYLGVCESRHLALKTSSTINSRIVFQKRGFCRGLHAIGLSKRGAERLLEMSRESNERYMDVLVEVLSCDYPANVCRYDLESCISGHRGVFYQDRTRFPSTI